MTEHSSSPTPSHIWRRPSLVAIVCFITALGILIGLGSWQLERRAWKHALLDKVTTRMAAPPVALGARITDPQALDYRRVTAVGRFLHEKEIYLAARTHRGKPGVHVITPLVRNGLAPVMINRGWVPQKRKDPGTRKQGQVAGLVTVTGIARMAAPKRLFTPDNNPATGFWMTYDTPAMAAALGIARPLSMVVEADAGANPGGLPRGGVTRIDFRNDHLQYAITWFSLALVLIVIFALYHREQKEAAA